MARTARRLSESGFYHVFSRGSGRQLIYENTDDRKAFLRHLSTAAEEFDTEIYAYCLMGNHYHLVVRASPEDLSSFGHKLNGAYAIYFNAAHERIGHLFQKRFSSQPIEDDSYLLSAIRYVHRNPVEAQLSRTCAYPWSSYGVYLGESSGGAYSFGESVPYVPVKTELALGMLGDVEAFESFHAHAGKETFADDVPMRARTDESEMLAIAREALDGLNPADVKSLPKPDRNHNLRALKATTLTLSQIALITGISRSTICRA